MTLQPPRLSVVVTIVDGGAALRRCLRSLTHQEDVPHLEILVPFDDTVEGLERLRVEFPRVSFLPLGQVETERPVTTAAGQHELFDRRRAAGLARATAPIVAIVEDRGTPRPSWAQNALALHDRLPYRAIGGAIDNGRRTRLNWAIYFCDFERYQPPFEAGPRAYISDVNIAYKRSALDDTRDLWAERYHETLVHWALQERGDTLFLSPEFVVEQERDNLDLRSVLEERIHWGRLFAYTRVHPAGSSARRSTARRLAWAAMTPVLPFLLALRHARNQAKKRITWREFVAASPLMFLLLVAWSAGEFLGYATARP